LGEGPDPSSEIRDGLMKLVEWGADILAVPCNTAHFFIDRFISELPVPLVHIVESTINEARNRSPQGAWLLSTKGTKQSGLYEKYAALEGYELFLPDHGIEEMVQESIHLVKSNRSADGGALLEEAVSVLKKDKDLPIVAACTELPLAYEAFGLPEEGMISSLRALAMRCLDQLYL
jgi:aspartate racemase